MALSNDIGRDDLVAWTWTGKARPNPAAGRAPAWRADFDRASAGGPEGGVAVTALLARFRPLILKATAALTFRDAERDDFDQELYLVVRDRVGTVQGGAAAFPGWLRAVAYHLAVRLARPRRAGRRAGWTDRDLPPGEPPDLSAPPPDVAYFAELERAETIDRVRRALAELARTSPAQGTLLAEFYWGELTVAEIAARHGLPTGTVKSRLFHARRRLRAILGAGDGRPASTVCL